MAEIPAEPPVADPANVAAPGSESPPAPGASSNAAETARFLRLKVPVIVELATRRLPVAAIRRFSIGSVVEFERSVHQPLSLLVNNQPVADGKAVKVGEHFGLRITSARRTT